MVEAVDYIIVGGGTAGCVVAERLSASGRDRVLLLEAGGSDRRFWVRVPIGYGRTFNDPAVNWMYEAEADPGLNGERSYWPRGKVLGGSGSINAMVYARGQPGDYDDWRDLGNPGWGWSDVLPHFRAIEDRGGIGAEAAVAHGPMRVTDVSTQAHPLVQSYIAACAEIGLPYTADFNGDQPEGVGIYPITTRGGLRESTATAFLRPALRRRNLELWLRTHVLKLDFEGRRAVGVRCVRGGQEQSLRARKAVVLCAGSIGSPQLLQLSGIGPGGLLQGLGIRVIHDAPAVGRNLQDHLAVSYFYRSRVPTLNNRLYPWWGKLLAGAQFVLTRRGPLSLSVNQGGGFIRSDPRLRAPDLQLYFNPASYTQSRTRTRRLMNPDPFPGFLTSFNSCRPTSRGHLAIRSPDPFAEPAIHPNYLSTEQDRRDVIIGGRLMRRLTSARPLAELIDHEMLPGAAKTTDEQLLQDFRERAGTVFHPVSTCKMGPDAADAVVDARLRVHGIENLRIVDASVFPTVTSGNTNGPTAMVAHKGAGMLLEDLH